MSTEQLPYSRSRFVEAVAKRNHFTERERDRAAWAVRELEMWARTRPVALNPLAYVRFSPDEGVDMATDEAMEHLYAQWPVGFPFGFITWAFFFNVMKLVATLWIQKMFSDRASYRIVMEG